MDYIFNPLALEGENGARHVSEASASHATGISTNEEDRLSYPQFITYNPELPSEIIEDVHIECLVASHFLTALKKDMVDYCKMDKDKVGRDLLNMLTETYAYLGDLSTTANDSFSTGSVNHLPNTGENGCVNFS